MRTLAAVTFAALLALGAAGALVAHSADGNYAGEVVDPVSGYPCVTPFCDTVALPGTDCLCVKANPNASRREDLRLECTDMKTRAQCSVGPG